jgi:hypothetical protein
LKDALGQVRGLAKCGRWFDAMYDTWAANGNGTPRAEPSKAVSQVLVEIIWRMTQSPRHKAISLGVLAACTDGLKPPRD